MRKIKKSIRLLLLCALTLMCLAATGCKGCVPESEKPLEPNYSLTLYQDEMFIIIGQERVLDADFTIIEGEALQFSSDDEGVATVNEHGVVCGVSQGTTKINVKYGTKTASCSVTVGVDNYQPMLSIPQVTGESVKIINGQTVNVRAEVLFAGKKFTDADVQYVLSDTTVGSVQNGIFTASKTGETTVTATATWRGMTGETLIKEFTVEILPNVQLFVNNGMDGKITMYTLDDESVPFSAQATEDGQELPVTVEIIEGQDVLEYDETLKTLSGVGISGEAKIRVSCTDSRGSEYQSVVPVSIRPTILPYKDGVITGFSAVDGNVVQGRTFAEILQSQVVEAYDQNGKALEVRDGNVYGIETSATGKTQTKITVCSRRMGYELDLEGYTRIIDEAKDLEIFGVFNTVSNTYDDGQQQSGYYVLGGNIDASGYVHESCGNHLSGSNVSSIYNMLGKQNVGLTGTFDGCGYTIHNLSVTRYGLFGFIMGGTLKNVGFRNVQFAGAAGAGSKGSNQMALAQYMAGATLENVYVHANALTKVTNARTTKSLVVGDTYGTMMSNCIFELEEDWTSKSPEALEGQEYGSFGYMWGNTKTAERSKDSFADVYVISKTPLTYRPDTNSDPLVDNSYLVDAENRITDDGSKKFAKTGIKRYDTYEDMLVNKNYFTEEELPANDYIPFVGQYWDMSSGVPKWATLNDSTEKFEQNNEFVGDFSPDWL